MGNPEDQSLGFGTNRPCFLIDAKRNLPGTVLDVNARSQANARLKAPSFSISGATCVGE